ncbi:hypothetical protein HAX54_031724 [Datura stramonium]|uniref:ATP-dependent Clp protease proteolytic subunit n=1 Tax=Datura stramonium TaxID=4076 RepID=A0ABS8SC30_DATST|nr:hypothetical protein [Datura stramonium]
MGSLLLAAGTKGERRSLPNASIMIHQPSGGYSGQAKDLTIHTKQIVRVWDTLNDLYAKHTGQPIDIIQKNMDRDYFMTPEEAKAFGIIDEVIDERPLALVTDAIANETKQKGSKNQEGILLFLPCNNTEHCHGIIMPVCSFKIRGYAAITCSTFTLYFKNQSNVETELLAAMHLGLDANGHNTLRNKQFCSPHHLRRMLQAMVKCHHSNKLHRRAGKGEPDTLHFFVSDE